MLPSRSRQSRSTEEETEFELKSRMSDTTQQNNNDNNNDQSLPPKACRPPADRAASSVSTSPSQLNNPLGGLHDQDAQGQVGSNNDEAENAEEPPKNDFIILTPEANTTTTVPTTEDEIIASYASSTSVPNSTLLYSARERLSLALQLRQELQDEEMCATLIDCIVKISSPEEANMAIEMARVGERSGEHAWGLRMRSLLVVAAAVGVLELVDVERAGEVRELLRCMTGEVERDARGMGKGKGKAVAREDGEKGG